MKTIIPLMIGKLNKMRTAIKKATHYPSVLKPDAPKYVTTNASAM